MVLTYGMDEGSSRIGGIEVERKEEKYSVGGIEISDSAPVGGIERSERYSLGGIEVSYSVEEELEEEVEEYSACERTVNLAGELEDAGDNDYIFPL